MIVLLDTNVLLSAALRDRLPEKVVRYVATDDQCRWVITAEILKEYLDVLSRPKFRLSADTLIRWAELIDMRAVMMPSAPSAVAFPRDPKDVPFLSAAVATSANFLITGDNDLLQAKLPMSTRIVSAAQFASELHIT